MDWTSLGQGIREAAEGIVAAGGMEATAVDLRRRLLALGAHPPLTSHPSPLVRQLVNDRAPSSAVAEEQRS
jgi:hypothetical protein